MTHGARTLCLWDIDGTLIRGDGAGRRAMERTGALIFGAQFEMSGIDFAGRLDPHLVTEAATQSGYDASPERLEQFRQLYPEHLVRELAKPTTHIALLPGVQTLLDEALSWPSHHHGLVTGNYAAAAAAKLERVGLSETPFRFCGFGDEGPTRPDLVALAQRRFRQALSRSPVRTVVIGDTPHDVSCGHAHGCSVVAVATGSYSREALLAAGADHVFTDFRDLDKMLQVLR